MAGAVLTAQTATTQKPFQPKVGQAGKDVVWVPTPQPTVDAMLDMAKLTKDDFLVDLGSGDGITVITAATRGARAMGIEFNPDMVALAQQRAKEAGMSPKEVGDLIGASSYSVSKWHKLYLEGGSEGLMLLVANLGDDADTTAAVYGQLAGAFYRESGLPVSWLGKLAMREKIISFAEGLIPVPFRPSEGH